MTQSGGIIIVNKERSYTSFDVVAKLRRIYGTRQIGHTGTLDPDATGVLAVLVGRAVKASEYIVSDKKRYSGTVRFGITTDTQDTSGKVLSRHDVTVGEEDVKRCAEKFVGKIMQTPPMFSALKIDGQKLCDLARKGKSVERAAREVEIYSLDISKITNEEYKFCTEVSKGTYIRTLCADMGKMLGCGGAMSSLCREKSGPFSLECAKTLSQIEEMSEEEREKLLIPVDKVFENYAALTLRGRELELFKNGSPVSFERLNAEREFTAGELYRVYDADGFLALGKTLFDDYCGKETASLKCEKLFRI